MRYSAERPDIALCLPQELHNNLETNKEDELGIFRWFNLTLRLYAS